MDDESKPQDLSQTAWATASEAIKQIEDAAFRKGYDAGFNAGWDAAARRLTLVMEGTRPAAEPSVMPQASSTLEAKRTAIDEVHDHIREYPGQRGVDIANWLGGSAYGIPERTVRTALYRLRIAEKIKNVNDRWYLSDAPVDSQQKLPLEE